MLEQNAFDLLNQVRDGTWNERSDINELTDEAGDEDHAFFEIGLADGSRWKIAVERVS